MRYGCWCRPAHATGFIWLVSCLRHGGSRHPHQPTSHFIWRSWYSSWLDLLIHSQGTQMVNDNYNGQTLTSSDVECGVPQGSVLGSILFWLYTADVPNIVQQHGLFLRIPMLTILNFMHTAKPNHVRRQLSKSLSALKILIGGCRQTVWNWKEIRHSSSGLALGNNWLTFSAAQYGSEMLTSECLQKWHALKLFLTVKSSLRHMWGGLLAGVSTICESCGRYAVRWPLTLQKHW